MVKKSFVSAPGKIILSGEHSVVHGQPAVLTAVNRRLFVKIETSKKGIEIFSDEPTGLVEFALQKTGRLLGKRLDNLKITIKSEIPVNRGMGSSAALAVAMVGGLFRWLDREWDKNLINQIAYEIEKKQHQNPSGADNSIACFGGLIVFQKGKIKKLKGVSLPVLVLLDSGRASESTGELVSRVSAKFQIPNSKFQKILNEMGNVTLRLIEVLKKRRSSDFQNLILENERLLEELGVVGNKAKKIIRKIEDFGGAAKICGAGGIKAGSGILLCYHQKPSVLLDFAKKNKIPSYQLRLGDKGLRNES
jgi:mevalonate kinase